jgi:hypothetical protein
VPDVAVSVLVLRLLRFARSDMPGIGFLGAAHVLLRGVAISARVMGLLRAAHLPTPQAVSLRRASGPNGVREERCPRKDMSTPWKAMR